MNRETRTQQGPFVFSSYDSPGNLKTVMSLEKKLTLENRLNRRRFYSGTVGRKNKNSGFVLKDLGLLDGVAESHATQLF